MANKTYNQHSALAVSLDILGERWTLLLIRELLSGPKRFKDLEANLHGICSNLLSARLKYLDSYNIIERTTLPPPANVPVYQLTPLGKQLEQPLLGILRWGTTFLSGRNEQIEFNPEWNIIAMKAIFNPVAAKDISLAADFIIDQFTYHAIIDDGALEAGFGLARNAQISIETDSLTLDKLYNNSLDVPSAIKDEKLRVGGDVNKIALLKKIFSA